ncbi:class I SAM-dependent methyltransferase [Falsirhodobacter algicola]|uniref:Class I SAM-dependent methyltransferase n=1 Tax=Falsirhodobacter algicola TaxID=2692330 RepID=A0A8J8SLV9_9RHOB|nr:SAM-dependent methyltransferase [Falsirhodobacter algicola]QUS36897.1 class I SAM-dependent methyltransferase [Falsirhodobacter algicola]
MTPLGDILARRIAQTGPISLADYMAECLLHPVHGYYTTREPFGTAGDFITAPEISQMFGELLGLCLAQHWLMSGGGPFTLAELGPGRGTLMADILRATRKVPGFHASADVVLVEASPRLRAIQAQRVPEARHVGSVHDMPDGPLWLVANEFFDALPIRQFVRDGAAWRERVVGPDLRPGLSAPIALPALEARLADTADGDVVEICPQAAPIMDAIAARVAVGGMALIVDYGGWQSRGDTFQAMADHAYVDPFAAPGQADLTAHVDFAALARLRPSYTTQGQLLTALGIAARAERLSAGGDDRHVTAMQRLTEPGQMGELFKALAITAPQAPPPPGFA